MFLFSSGSTLLRTCLLASLIQTAVLAQELILPPSLEGRRGELLDVIRKAQERVGRFCESHDWSFLLRQPILGKVEIYESKAAFDDQLRRLYPEAAKGPIPRSFAAGFEGDTFFAVAPEIYAKNVPQFVEPDFYEKLIAHEIAHKLHTRLLHGHEEKMDPIWFWEGFATFVSGQFDSEPCTITPEQLRAVLNNPKRGDYRQYNQAFKCFIPLVPIQELVRRAADEDFNDWLLQHAAH